MYSPACCCKIINALCYKLANNELKVINGKYYDLLTT